MMAFSTKGQFVGGDKPTLTFEIKRDDRPAALEAQRQLEIMATDIRVEFNFYLEFELKVMRSPGGGGWSTLLIITINDDIARVSDPVFTYLCKRILEDGHKRGIRNHEG